MLRPEQIDAIQDRLLQLIDPINLYLVADIADRVAHAGALTRTADYEMKVAQKLGVDLAAVEKYLDVLLTRNQAACADLFETTAKTVCSANRIEIDNDMKSVLENAISLANDELKNLTQTKALGFVTPRGATANLLDAYRETCDYAFTKVATGAQDYNSAIRDALKNITQYGAQYMSPDGITIGYESGQKISLDAAVRRNIMGGLGLMVEQLEQKSFDAMGADGWEISAHEGSAPDHEDIQGRQYSDKDFRELNNSLVRRISTLNCKHIAFPIILGVNEPQYSKEDLAAMKKRNHEGITYEGKHYSIYEATQMQRRIERSIRLQRRRIAAYEAAGDGKALQTAQIKEVVLSQRYKEFSEAAGLRTQPARLETIGYGPRQKTILNPHSVIDEYFRNAQPKQGEFLLEEGYKIGKHKIECSNAQWLHNTFGGDIKLLKENHIELTPDYEWRSSFWEHKSVSSLNSVDQQLRYGLKQIAHNPGGVIIECAENISLTDEEIINAVKNRLKRRKYIGKVDVMIKRSGELIEVLRSIL